MEQIGISNRSPVPEFLDIPWGASKEEAKEKMLARSGVILAEEGSGGVDLLFRGGLFANKDVRLWVLQFVDDQLHTAKVQISPPAAMVIDIFKDLAARFEREYGAPAQGGILVVPGFEGRELEAIRAGKGAAMVLHTFGPAQLEGSILCQVSPDSHIVISYQNEQLNQKAIGSMTGLDAPVQGVSRMQTQVGGGGSSCFVVTATLQDEDHPVVCLLRQYRDAVLRRRRLGRWAIALYNVVGPHIAPVIASRPRLRIWIYRTVLMPARRHVIKRLQSVER